jgi:hypothetical protein
MMNEEIINENPKSAVRFDAFADGHVSTATDRENLVIHDKEGNFNGQVEIQSNDDEKYFDCHGTFAGQSSSLGTFDAHGTRVGSVFDLHQISDCRGAR